MPNPVPFSSHIEKLMVGFRSAIPQVAALIQFMPDELLRAVVHELDLLIYSAQKELERRRIPQGGK